MLAPMRPRPIIPSCMTVFPPRWCETSGVPPAAAPQCRSKTDLPTAGVTCRVIARRARGSRASAEAGMEMIGIDVGGTRHQGRGRRDDERRARDRARARPDAAPRDAEGRRSRRRPGWSPSCRATLHAGIGFPAVIIDGVVKTAANIDPSWIGTPADTLFADALGRSLIDRQRRRRRGARRDALRRRPRAGGHRADAHARDRHRLGAVPRRRPRAEHRARAPAGARQGRRAARRSLDQGSARASAGTPGASAWPSTSTSSTPSSGPIS